jgi:hypothetical protein
MGLYHVSRAPSPLTFFAVKAWTHKGLGTSSAIQVVYSCCEACALAGKQAVGNGCTSNRQAFQPQNPLLPHFLCPCPCLPELAQLYKHLGVAAHFQTWGTALPGVMGGRPHGVGAAQIQRRCPWQGRGAADIDGGQQAYLGAWPFSLRDTT